MRILLVDDEVELADSLAQLFRREGYSVDVAYDGETAQALLQGDLPTLSDIPYDLLILDWMLPGRSGVDLCRALRAAGHQTPVLFLTAKDTLDDRVDGLDAGADDYMVKPFELRELLARVRAQLRRSQAATLSTDRIQIGDIELDRDNQVVYRQGRMISLSDKEFRLLDYFMTHAGQLLTHEQIHRYLWPEGDRPSSNVLAAQVRLLRRKLEGHSSDAQPAIRAIYGKGYRLVVEPSEVDPGRASPK